MEDFNFKLLGYFDTKKILDKILNLNNEWYEYTYRQDTWEVHNSTITIPILYDETHSRMIGKKSKFYNLFEEDINELNEYFKNIIGKTGTIIRLEIVKMLPHSKIGLHTDNTYSLTIDNRIHIPIQTNEKVIFNVGGEEKNMKINEVWEINNGFKIHGVSNDSDYDRIHLILDWKNKPSKIV